ncbi:MAG: hypothetical protein FJ027_06255 [Candidatus Rokubacteria bacterium]|nr:hypothetical protein [Candidatus Rokubacteria bacterium]
MRTFRCHAGRFVLLVVIALSSAACANMGGIIGGTVGATLAGAASPTHEVEQIYYLGVFDGREQLPESIYRITVKGQASFLSFTKFASGWVPAAVVDSLGGKVSLSAEAATQGLTITAPHAEAVSNLQTGRRLVLFGPEGFREAPRDHRLVIVMGTSPENFFKAIDTALGDMAQIQVERDSGGLQRELMQALADLRGSQKAYADIEVESLRESAALKELK